MSEEQKRPMPLAEILERLRNRPRLTPALRRLVDERHEHYADATGVDFDVQQIATILKAAEMATQAAPNHPANFQHAAGYIAGLILDETDYARAKALAATL